MVFLLVNNSFQILLIIQHIIHYRKEIRIKISF